MWIGETIKLEQKPFLGARGSFLQQFVLVLLQLTDPFFIMYRLVMLARLLMLKINKDKIGGVYPQSEDCGFLNLATWFLEPSPTLNKQLVP